jgi:hypothetical protein
MVSSSLRPDAASAAQAPARQRPVP